MKSLFVLLVSFACLAFVARDNRFYAAISQPSAPLACSGCVASQVNDPNAVPPITNGVQVLFQGAGVTLPICFLSANPGKCEIVPDIHGVPGCFPTDNCKFSATYSILSTGGQFHDNQAPCNWSVPAGGGREALAGSISWIAACDNGQTWVALACYDNATSCTTGTRNLEIKFIGKCTVCTD